MSANQPPNSEENATLQLPTASVDLDRTRRCGFPEVIYGEGKTSETIAQIATELHARCERVLATRIEPTKAAEIAKLLPEIQYNPTARTLRLGDDLPDAQCTGHVAVISAGTSDLSVAEEAHQTLLWMGVRVSMVHDVGVAGPHRLPQRLAEFENADALVVVAGMEGALPSVVGGYVGCPVFAVPTSVGYGANL